MITKLGGWLQTPNTGNMLGWLNILTETELVENNIWARSEATQQVVDLENARQKWKALRARWRTSGGVASENWAAPKMIRLRYYEQRARSRELACKCIHTYNKSLPYIVHVRTCIGGKQANYEQTCLDLSVDRRFSLALGIWLWYR